MITFVTYYAPIPKEAWKKVNRFSFRLIPFDPVVAIETQYASIKKNHPEAKYVVITDKETKLDVNEEIKIIRTKIDPSPIAYSKLLAFYRFLKKAPGKMRYVFFDTDVLVQKTVDSLFEERVDITLFRRENYLPILTSVFLVNEGSKEKGIEFLKGVISIMLNHEKKNNIIYQMGDRYAFNKFFGLRTIIKYESKIGVCNDIKFQFQRARFHCLDAFYPKKAMRRFPHPEFLHFSGEQFKFMKPYYEKFIK